MKLVLPVLAVLTSVVLVTPAFSLSGSAPHQMALSELAEMCAGPTIGNACRFYILGVIEGVSLAAGVAQDGAHFCIPDELSSDDMVATVTRLAAADLAKFPEDRLMPAVSFIGASLIHAYPCIQK